MKKNNRYKARVAGYSFGDKLPSSPDHGNITKVAEGPVFE
jgi:hypothetical protein